MSATVTDFGRAKHLASARRRATGLLTGMGAAYLVSLSIAEPSAWLQFIQAVAEAGLVGGLADWFAVTALFRHPLGVPIPHTALLPRNQARAAQNVGRFFETHFLVPDHLEARIRAARPSCFLAGWLEHPGNAEALAQGVTDLIAASLWHEPPRRLLARARRWLRRQAAEVGSDAVIAERVAELIKAGARSRLLDDILNVLRDTIENNRDGAVALVQARSRWWIAASVDRELAHLVLTGVLSVLDDLRTEDSEIRRDFQGAIDRMVDTLAAEGGLTRAVGEARLGVIRSGAFDETVVALAAEARNAIVARVSSDREAAARPLADTMRQFMARALAEPATRDAVDARLAQFAAKVVGENRRRIGAYIADVIAGWEPEDLNARFEAEVGPDLQHIRVNGTILGAAIGGVLFALGIVLGG